VVSDINPTQYGRTVVVQGISLRRHAAIRLLPARPVSSLLARSSKMDDPLLVEAPMRISGPSTPSDVSAEV
jgi:hypothetical protein